MLAFGGLDLNNTQARTSQKKTLFFFYINKYFLELNILYCMAISTAIHINNVIFLDYTVKKKGTVS